MKKAILISYYDWYEKRLKYLIDELNKHNFEVKYYTSNINHFTKKKVKIKYSDRILVNVPLYKKNLSFKRVISLYIFSKKTYRILKKEKPDLVYCILPPNFLTKKISGLRAKSNFKLIFDVIDLWPETMPVSKFKDIFPLSYWKNLRDRYINRADYVITECNLYHKYLNVDKEKLKTIYLAAKSSIHQTNLNLDNQILSLCYLGSINNIIDIKKIGEVIKIISTIKPVTLKIVGDGEKKEELINEVEKSGAKVIYYGKIFDEKEKQKIFDTCHFGLNIYKDNTLIGLTMKSIDYLRAGLPIINNIKEDSYNIVNKYNCGVNLNDIDYLKYLSTNYDMEMRKNAKDVFEKYFSYSQIQKKYKFLINNK